MRSEVGRFHFNIAGRLGDGDELVLIEVLIWKTGAFYANEADLTASVATVEMSEVDARDFSGNAGPRLELDEARGKGGDRTGRG